MEKLTAWVKAHPWEAGGIGFLVVVVILWWLGYFSSSSGSGGDLAAYYNAEAAAAASGEQTQALQDQLQAATTYYSTQGSVATGQQSTDLQIAQAQANAATQQAQIAADAATAQAQAAAKATEVTARQATVVGVAQANDALKAAVAGFRPAVLGSMDYQAFLDAFAGSGGGSTTTGAVPGAGSTTIGAGGSGGIYAQGTPFGPGPNALFGALVSPGSFGAPGTGAGTLVFPFKNLTPAGLMGSSLKATGGQVI